MQKNPEKKPKINSFFLAIVFLVLGIYLFIVAVLLGSQIICLVGLGLTFWGALFLLAPPSKHVEANFLITSSLPDYMTIDRMLTYINSKNEAYNIPPCPKDIDLPQHLEGLKDMVTFIPAEGSDGIVKIEDIARSKFLIEKPKGLLITSPGVGLLEKIEQKNNTDFSKIPLNVLETSLPFFFSNLYLTKEITMTTNENDLTLKFTGSLYQNLYDKKYSLKCINLLGCPLVNAAACAVAKSAGKPTMVQKIEITPNGKTIIANFKVINRVFEERQKLIDDVGKLPLRRNELLTIMDCSIGLVDLSFDILVTLREKRINWQRIEEKAKDLGATFSFTGQTMPSLNLDFQKLSSTIKKQLLRETTKEIRDILKVIYDYFDGLTIDDDIKEGIPNFVIVKAIILSYYVLNDLLLAKAFGDKDNTKEIRQLESVLQILSINTEFKVDIDTLKASINKEIADDDLETFIYDSREIFKEQLKLLDNLYSKSVSNGELSSA
jgi:hypothetical protein